MEELLEGLCRMSALGISDFLDRRFQAVRQSKDHRWDTTGIGSVAYSTHPISSALVRWPFQLFLLLVAAVFYRSGIMSVQVFTDSTRDYAFGPYVHYRLETLLTRNGTFGSQLVGSGLSDFGVLGLNKCSPQGSFRPDDILTANVSWSAGSSIVATYPGDGVSMTGWYMHTGNEANSQAMDPAFYIVWGTNETPELGDGSCAVSKDVEKWNPNPRVDVSDWCGARWERVAQPTWTYGATSFWGFQQLPVSLPLERGSEGLVTILLQPPWYHYVLYWIVGDISSAFACLLSVSTAVLTRALPRTRDWFIPPAHWVLGIGIGVASFSALVHSMVSAAEGIWHHTFETGSAAFSLSFLVAAALFQGYNIAAVPSLFWVFALVQNMSKQLYCLWVWHDFFYSYSTSGVSVAILAMIISILRRKAIMSSGRMIKKDQLQYDVQWKSLTSNQDSLRLLREVEELIKSLDLPDSATCRQCNRLRLDSSKAPRPAPSDSSLHADDDALLHPLFKDLGLNIVSNAHDVRSPVTSCNQLYCQAAIANLLLIERLKEWAGASSSMFKSVDGPGALIRWSDVQHNESLRKKVKWTRMKAHGRTIEKLMRSYNDSPSRVVDIARQCVIFDNMTDLKKCLETIIFDENVAIKRVKNRYSTKYDAEATGGYRDVSINLRLVSQQAQALGAELHIVEVQLLLREYVHMKTEAGHERYVRSRNLAGR
mmetsp:Transcript_32412/g.75509  ORF Transcript_32412/g.75509 Transcript_32412/m.75509 type:complete len:710 (-) Transcript_32412:171-2300(-)